MSEERRGKIDLIALGQDAPYCIPDAYGHCATCSDEALPATVLSVDADTGLAVVQVHDTTEEIDITLVEDVAPGDVLLVHGGVAISAYNG
jgi:hypothetical protein